MVPCGAGRTAAGCHSARTAPDVRRAPSPLASLTFPSLSKGRRGQPLLDWKNPDALRYVCSLIVFRPICFLAGDGECARGPLVVTTSELTRVLLREDFDIKWNLPNANLCPTVRSRAHRTRVAREPCCPAPHAVAVSRTLRVAVPLLWFVAAQLSSRYACPC